MTDIVISHQIMGMTSLSCWRVTSKFRLGKHMSHQLFLWAGVIFSFGDTNTHKCTKSDLSLGEQSSIFIHWLSTLIPVTHPKINARLPHILIPLWRSNYSNNGWIGVKRTQIAMHAHKRSSKSARSFIALMPPWPCSSSTNVSELHTVIKNVTKERSHQL